MPLCIIEAVHQLDAALHKHKIIISNIAVVESS